MLNKHFFLYFTILFLGFSVSSPGGVERQPSEVASKAYQLDGLAYLHENDIKAAELYLPYISKYVDNDESVIPLVLAVMKAESNFEIQARSHKGALGLMQLMPTTALDEYRRYGMNAALSELEKNLILQPELNIALGVKHLRMLRERLEGIENPDKHRKLVIASYNAGIHRVKRAFDCKGFECYKYKANRYSNTFFIRSMESLPAETRNYLVNVERYYKVYKKVLTDERFVSNMTI